MPSIEPKLLYRVELTGASRRRGLQHGRSLKEPIRRAVEFYRQFLGEHLKIDLAEMRRRAERFIEPTARMSPLLMSEFEGIADGCGQRLEDLFVITARYEITYEQVRLGECSNLFVGPHRSASGHTLLGMNWDWRPEVLDFRAVITARCDDMPDHIVVTECGQPGKFGVNEHGLAVIETGLACGQPYSVGQNLFANLVRHILAQPDLEAGRRVAHDHPPEATVSFFIADSACGVNVEAASHGLTDRPMGADDVCWHTNHCLHSDEPCQFEDSIVRGRRWQELIATAPPRAAIDWQTVGRWLADTENGPRAICKAPDPALAHTTTWLQTLCSTVIAPRDRALWVSNGLSSRKPYVRFALS